MSVSRPGQGKPGRRLEAPGPPNERLLEVARELVSELDLEEVLAKVLEAARELTGARYAALGVLNESKRGLERFLYRGIGDEVREMIGALPQGHGVLGELIRDPKPLRLTRIADHPHSYGFPAGHPEMTTFLGAPILIRGEPWGNLYLADREGGEFTQQDEEIVVLLAGWASVAVANARQHGQLVVRRSIAAAEAERKRWARELHDEALQEIGALTTALDTAARQPDEDVLRMTVSRALEHAERSIEALRRMINELRPAAIDQLGLKAALEALADRLASTGEVRVECVLDLDGWPADAGGRPREVELTLYRLIQESLNNAIKHSGASRIDVRVTLDDGVLRATVRDNGAGFDPERVDRGFGLIGMRERMALADGRLVVESEPGRGTTVRAELTVGQAVPNA